MSTKRIIINPAVLSSDCKDLNQSQNVEIGNAVKRIAAGNTQLEDIAPCHNAKMRDAGCKRWKPSAERRALDVDEVRFVYRETADTIEVIAVGARAEDAVYKTAYYRFSAFK